MRPGPEREKVASSIQSGIVGALTSPANSPEKLGGFGQRRVDPPAHGRRLAHKRRHGAPVERGPER